MEARRLMGRCSQTSRLWFGVSGASADSTRESLLKKTPGRHLGYVRQAHHQFHRPWLHRDFRRRWDDSEADVHLDQSGLSGTCSVLFAPERNSHQSDLRRRFGCYFSLFAGIGVYFGLMWTELWRTARVGARLCAQGRVFIFYVCEMRQYTYFI